MDIANLVIRVTNDGLTAAQRELRRLRDEVSRNVDANAKMKQGLDDLSKWAAIGLGALGGTMAVATKKAMSFESAMAEVNKTVDFASSDGLANMRKQLEGLTKEIPQSFEELAGVAAVAGQLGIAEKDIVGFTETIAKMGVAFDMSSASAADSMAKIANVFALPIENIGELGDTINTLSNSMASTAPNIIDFMMRSAALAKTFKLSADDTAAFGSALVALGWQPEVASTAFNSMIMTLSDLDGLSKSGIIGLQQLGLDTLEFAEIAKTDGKGAILEVIAAVNKLEESSRIAALSNLFGKEAAAKIASMATGLETVNGALAATADTAGSMQKEFEAISGTTANKMELFKNNIDLAVTSLGDAFIPMLNEMLMAMTPVIEKITTWVEANPELVRQIILITASVLASIIGIKLFADGVTAAITTVQNLKTAFDLAKVGILALGSPIGLTIIAITALVLAGALIYQNWEQVKQIISDNRIAFGLLAVAITGLGSVLLAAKLPMVVTAVQMGVMATASAAWSVAVGVATAATWTFNAALIVLTSPIFAIVAAIALITAGGYLVVKNWSAISAGLRAEFERIKGAVMSAVNGMQAAWDRGVANTRTAFISIGNTIVSTLKGFIGKMAGLGKDFIQGFINGIKSVGSGVASAATTMVGNAIAAVKKRQDSASPSKVTTKLGGDFSQGMANGIKKGAKVVKTEAQRMVEGAIKSIKDGIAGLKKELALFGNDSKLAAFNYDVSVGTFNGASSQDINQTRSLLSQIEATKAEADAKSKLAAANKTVQDSIDGLIKQQALFGNSSSYASLVYDIENTEKYKGVSEDLLKTLKEQALAYEQLGMTAKATEAIRSRFAKLQTDREASRKAVDGVMTELVNESPLAKIESDYKRRLDIIAENEMLETGIIGAEVDKRKAIEQSYMDAKRDLLLSGNEKLFGSLANIAKGFAGEQSGIYRAMFAVEKGLALARVLLASKTALALAWASAPFPANLGAVALAAAETGVLQAAVGAINPKGFKQGGYTGNMGASQVAGVVHGQEYVFDAQATKRIGVDNLNAMRSGKTPAGGDVSINIINNSSARVEASDDGKTITITDVNNAVDRGIKRSWTNTGNPNSFESKQLNRNLQAPRRR